MTRALAVAALVSWSACAAGFLRFAPVVPSRSQRGRLAIVVSDRRPEGSAGAADRRRVGTGTAFGGIPVDIRLERAEEVTETMTELFGQAVRADGLGVARPGDERTGRLDVAVSTLACEGGALRAKARVVVEPSIRNPASGEVWLPLDAISVEAEATDCQEAYELALGKLLDAALVLFDRRAVKDAALGFEPQVG
jgi:hypothetical protein